MENRNYKDILLNRLKLSELCAVNPDMRATAIEQCKKDKVFWSDNFCFTFNPKVVPSTLPFILYPKQIAFVEWLDSKLALSRREEKINAVIDKPRDIGFTYTLMSWILWHFLFSVKGLDTGDIFHL